MAVLGVLFFFASILILIIGMIRPKILLWDKNPTRKKVLLYSVGSFVLSIILLASSPQNDVTDVASNNVDTSTNDTQSENSAQENSTQNEDKISDDVLTFAGEVTLDVVGENVVMTVNSNVPDGGLFELSLMNGNFDIESYVVPIEGGKIVKEFTKPKEWGLGYISSMALFRFNLEDHPQPDHIKEIYGETGEKMLGDLTLDNNLNGKNGNLEVVTIAYPNESTVKKEQQKLFGEAIEQLKELGNGVVIDISPRFNDGDWSSVNVVVSDAWYYSQKFEQERFAEQIGGTVESLVINSGMVNDDFVQVYFVDSYGKDVATPGMFGGYKIKE